MTTEAGFLREIIAHPDDDAPRLIYSDWLEEQGHVTHAEFIRVQIQLAEIDAIAHTCYQEAGFGVWQDETECAACGAASHAEWLESRERELLDGVCGLGVEALPIIEGLTRSNFVGKGGYGWYPRGGSGLTNGIEATFRRGFVEEVTTPVDVWAGVPCPHCCGMGEMRRIRFACPYLCNSGRVGAYGPAIVKAVPIARVVPGDREPHRSENGQFVWRLSPRAAQGVGNTIPAAIWWLMAGDQRTREGKWFADREAAMQAASDACIRWALSF